MLEAAAYSEMAVGENPPPAKQMFRIALRYGGLVVLQLLGVASWA